MYTECIFDIKGHVTLGRNPGQRYITILLNTIDPRRYLKCMSP